MTIKDIANVLEELAPLSFAEDFDNVGLLVGDINKTVNGILVTLDSLENVIEEAIAKKCNLIISFHPIVFKGIKKLTGKSYVERSIIKAIQKDIAIYCLHTALDNAIEGVNAKICDILELNKKRILIPKPGTLKKLVTYVPQEKSDDILEKLFAAGAGKIGAYRNCSFTVEGIGSYQADEKARPYKGTIGELHLEKENQISVVFTKDREHDIIRTLLKHHPYEEVAYEISTLDNPLSSIGMGMIGELSEPIDEKTFFEILKKKMNVSVIRHSAFLNKKIKNVAVLGGSGAFAIKSAKEAGADVLVTSDLKYHQFFEAESEILLADIGHFETEQFTKNLLVDYLTKKLPNFAISLSESITNPIKYY
ncbi:Nif3-like dinuclear metal center hexameric protein [Eudoraea sp.]|uniref:Nif3-like dinuclear metal center hexameric protein n=1 Tax=Eudoraea sp. TaxID=1979955 RepID=UPI003C792750